MDFLGFKKVLPYAIVVFFGYVGFSMPLPLLPEMFLSSSKQSFLFTSSIETFFSPTIWLGIMMAAYPMGQLLGSPVLGKCSDLLGRKKVILLSLVGAMIGYVISAIAASSFHLLGLFGGLFISGLCEGNVSIAQSVVADLAAPGEKGKKASYFGWINLFVCFAFIIGPLIGGSLSQSFSFSTPFWLAACMTLLGLFVIMKFSEETKRNVEFGVGKESSGTNTLSFGYWKSFKEGLKQPSLCKMYGINFFLALGYFSFFRFFPVYLQEAFSFHSGLLGYAIAYGSVVFALCSFLFLKRIGRVMRASTAVGVFSLGLALSFLLVLWVQAPFGFLITTLPVNFCLAIVMTYATVLVSDASSLSFQGQALGVLTSVQVLAEVLTGIGGGFLASKLSSLPILIGSGMLLIPALFLLASHRKKGDDPS